MDISLSEILLELSNWITDRDIKIDMTSKNGVISINIVFFENSPNIPQIYVLDKYVILVKQTHFIYKNLYEVIGVIDLASNYTEFQKRQ